MLIQVHYSDDRFDYVKDSVLDSLIEMKKITGFRRSTGWVILGLDPVRTKKRDYTYKTPSEVRRLVV